jgi:DNA-binding beta-propeller fold protein YncE
MSVRSRAIIATGLAAILLPFAGYARSLKSAPAPVFYPLPPDEPRIQYLTSFSSERELQGQRKFFEYIVGAPTTSRAIVKPYGIAAGPGKYYVCDTGASAVGIADLKKRSLKFFQPSGVGVLSLPVNIAVDTDGTRYITDTQRNMVLVYNGDNYAGSIGAPNEMKPCGVALSKSRIYVTDLQNHCVRVYDKTSRNLLSTFPKPGSDKKATLYSPTNVATDQQGHVYVSDTGGFCVNVYDADGKFLRNFGGIGLMPGQFARPKGIAVDRQGLIYVVDASTELVQLFNPDGRILMYFGDPTHGATGLPAGIAIDYDNVGQFQRYVAPGFTVEYLILVANQTGGNKISVFGFGHKK